jgi:hypothetical protein
MPGEQRLALGQLELDQPADLEVGARPCLRQARQSHGGVRRLGPKLVHLALEPTLEFVGGDRHTRLAADRDLNHAPIVEANRVDSNGCQPPSRRAQMGQRDQEWCFVRMGARAAAGKYGAMRGNPFFNFQRAAEDAGYPALLIVSALCLGLVVAPIALLGLTQAIWVLGLALLSLIAAVAVLAGAMDAAFSDYGEPVGEPQKLDVAAPGERDPAAPLPRRLPANRQAGQDRRAA